MVGSTLGVYSFGLIFVSARTNKIAETNKRHHHHHLRPLNQRMKEKNRRRKNHLKHLNDLPLKHFRFWLLFLQEQIKGHHHHHLQHIGLQVQCSELRDLYVSVWITVCMHVLQACVHEFVVGM